MIDEDLLLDDIEKSGLFRDEQIKFMTQLVAIMQATEGDMYKCWQPASQGQVA